MENIFIEEILIGWVLVIIWWKQEKLNYKEKMQVTFLGPGLNSDNKNNVGKQLANSFESKYFNTFFGFVAFAATTGIQKMVPK